MIPSYPKVFTVGDRHSLKLLDNHVQVTEKIDGSQFAFAKINGTLLFRSKGQQIFIGSVPNLFKPAVDYIVSIHDLVPENIYFYGETLCKPKHNTLAYINVPKNHITLFAALNIDGSAVPEEDVLIYAAMMKVDHVPVIYTGPINNFEAMQAIQSFLDRDSYLGGQKIEGVVIKNFKQELLIGGQVFPFLQAKYVSEAFKEVHQKSWSKENTGKGKWLSYVEGFRTEARWLKAVQHLRDSNLLDQSPKDIGPLLKEIAKDIIEEEKENIKEKLWNEFGKECIRKAQAGFPEWYKEYLVKQLGE